jgi:hypothetical protein
VVSGRGSVCKIPALLSNKIPGNASLLKTK